MPETGDKTDYAWSTDFDPAIGFTQIYTEMDVCLRLATPLRPEAASPRYRALRS